MKYTLYLHSTGRILQSGMGPEPERLLEGKDNDHRILLEVMGDPETQRVENEELVSFIRTKSLEEIQNEVVAGTQQRLDDFAQTRGYDNIMSVCTYATSTRPKRAGEGQRAVELRDATWDTLYQMLAEVQAGTRPIPSGFADLEPDLPNLEWPT